MIDTKHYYETYETSLSKPTVGLQGADERQENDLAERDGPRQKPRVPFDDYDNIDPYTRESLEDDQYLICSYQVWAFVLKIRQWGE